jgi:hypothetical protein
MATQTQTRTQAQRQASAQKAAATRRRKAAARSRSAKKAAETRAQAELNTLQVVQHQAERAALIPLGAALTARDAVLEAAAPYVAGRESAERELEKVGKRLQVNLKRFERRGTTARNRALREVKRTRTRVERELRQRRNKAVRTVKQNRRDLERQVKRVASIA